MSDTFDASHAHETDTFATTEPAQHRWVSTDKARTEGGISTVALSIRQRRLLTLLASPLTPQALAERANTPLLDVQAALTRFAALGLAYSDAPKATPAEARASAALRPSLASPRKRSAKTSRPNSMRLPLLLGATASVGAALTIWFFVRPTTPPAIATPTTATTAAAAQTAVPNATAPANTLEPSASSSSTPGTPLATSEPATGATALRAAIVKDASTKAATKDGNTAPSVTLPAAAPPVPDARAPATTSAATPSGPVASSPATAAAPTASPPAAATPNAAPTAASGSAPTPAAPAALAPVATAAPTAPAPTSPAVAAAATPARAAAPAAAPREGRLLERVEPAYPRNVQYETGTVRARLSVNAAGAVTGVEIMSSNPPRVFDRSVSTALTQWKYEATGEASTKLVEVSFQR